jgi:hypothetical protein
MVGAVLALIRFAEFDTLSRYRGEAAGMEDAGVVVPQAEITVWREGRKRAFLQAGRLVFTRDRRMVALDEQVRARLISGRPGGEVKVELASARYDFFERLISSDQKLNLKSQDFDLKAGGFEFDEGSGILKIPGQTSGRLNGGRVSGGDFLADLPRRDYRLSSATWLGPAALGGQPKMWDLKGLEPRFSGGVYSVKDGRAAESELIVKAKRIVWDTKTDILTATGDVRIFSPEANFRSDEAVVYRREKRILLRRNAVLLSKAKGVREVKEEPIPAFERIAPAQAEPTSQGLGPEGEGRRSDEELRKTGNLRDYPLSAAADQIEYFYAEGGRRAEIDGEPQARQELREGRWRRLWAQRARYDREAEQLLLFSRPKELDVRFKSSIGDDFRAETVELSTREGVDDWSADRAEGIAYGDPDGDGVRRRRA